MKFKIGDKVIIKKYGTKQIYFVCGINPKAKCVNEECTYRLECADGDVVGWWRESSLELVETDHHTDVEECDTDSLKAEYERGLNDAWEATRKIILVEKYGGIPYKRLEDIFHKSDVKRILRDYSASEAIEKLKAWEEKNEIKVGDEIVYADGVKSIVVGISNYNEEISVLNNKYDIPQLLTKNKATKTGRHFDAIEEVLKQIQEET